MPLSLPLTASAIAQAVAPSTSGNVLTSNGTTWTSAAASAPTVPNSSIFLSGFNNFGSSGTAITRWSNIKTNVGSDITLTQSSTNGDSFTINTAGLYYIVFTYQAQVVSNDCHMGISLNQVDLTQPPGGGAFIISNAQCLAYGYMYGVTDGNNAPSSFFGVTKYLSVNDVIRASTDHGPGNDSNIPCFSIVRIA